MPICQNCGARGFPTVDGLCYQCLDPASLPIPCPPAILRGVTEEARSGFTVEQLRNAARRIFGFKL